MSSGRGRSHPPTLIRLVERALRDECRLARGETILVATSGGGDSTALLHALSMLSRKMGFALVAHGVDHGLRPEASAELDVAAGTAATLGVRFERTRVKCKAGANLQARARAERRRALKEAARHASASRIATAHHADDRAETVLIRLLNGASPAGLAVLPAADGPWIRPMIRARKGDVAAHLARHGLAYAEDPSNQNRRFLRVRVRLEVMPLLEDLSPSIVQHLTSLADDLADPRVLEVADAAGRPIPLRRAHVRALRRAAALGRSLTIRVSGGKDVPFEPKGSKMTAEVGQGGRGPARASEKGGAKTRKSG